MMASGAQQALTEVAVVDAALGTTTIFAWDGRVLELFSDIAPTSALGDSMRFHVRRLQVQVSGPDRKGRWTVVVGNRGAGGCRLAFDEAAMTELRPLLDEIQAHG